MLTIKVGEAKVKQAYGVGAEAEKKVKELSFKDPFVLITLGNEVVKTFIIEGQPENPNWGQLFELEVPKKVSEVKVSVFNRADRSCQWMADQIIGEAYISITQIPFRVDAPWPLRKRRNGLITGYITLNFTSEQLEEEQKKMLEKISSKQASEENANNINNSAASSIVAALAGSAPTAGGSAAVFQTLKGGKATIDKMKATFALKKRKKEEIRERIRLFNESLNSRNSESENDEEFNEFFNHIELDLSSCEISDIPPELFEEFERSPLTLNNVNLNYNSLTSLRPLLFHLKLSKLQVNSNPIRSLPNEIGTFIWAQSLTYLSLSHCQLIDDIPPHIGFLQNLRFLDISHNSLQRLPDNIGYLNNLKFLLFNNNEGMTFIPSTICYLTTLQQLNGSCCSIQSLPPSFCLLNSLVELRLSSNQINHLPINFGKLNNLTILSLSENQLTDVPLSMAHCSSLKVIDFSINPISDRSLGSAMASGAPSFLTFLSTRLKKNKNEVLYKEDELKGMTLGGLPQEPSLPPLMIPPKPSGIGNLPENNPPRKSKSRPNSPTKIIQKYPSVNNIPLSPKQANNLEFKNAVKELRLSKCFTAEDVEGEEIDDNELQKIQIVCEHLKREGEEIIAQVEAYKKELMNSLTNPMSSASIVERNQKLHSRLHKVYEHLEPFETRSQSSGTNFEYNLTGVSEPALQNPLVVRSSAVLLDSIQRRYLSLKTIINKEKPIVLFVSNAILALRDIKAIFDKSEEEDQQHLSSSSGSSSTSSQSVTSSSLPSYTPSSKPPLRAPPPVPRSPRNKLELPDPSIFGQTNTPPRPGPPRPISTPPTPQPPSVPQGHHVTRAASTSYSTSNPSTEEKELQLDEETRQKILKLKGVGKEVVRCMIAKLRDMEQIVYQSNNLNQCMSQGKIIMTTKGEIQELRTLLSNSDPPYLNKSTKSVISIAPIDGTPEAQKLANLQSTIVGLIRDLTQILVASLEMLKSSWEVKEILGLLTPMKVLKGKLLPEQSSNNRASTSESN